MLLQQFFKNRRLYRRSKNDETKCFKRRANKRRSNKGKEIIIIIIIYVYTS